MGVRKQPSAFRAVNINTEQSVGPADFTLIAYPNVIYDLNEEYDNDPNFPNTFIPKQDGIYLIIASMSFVPGPDATNYSCRMLIAINEEDTAAADNDFFGVDVQVTNLVSVSSVTNLSKGDRVFIFGQATTDGNTLPEPSFMHFEAIKLL
ncbi:hypothetical protein V7149_19680 [Bacillus sp. JJ1503]|uniref:hypothetical protein n=1 Tax=unclassified Bacillus (in: firmicutes) TaxID=185979 RepID=UPI002FFFCFB1